MQDAALNFLRHIRSTIEAAEQGLLTEEDLVAGRNSLNELLDLDWVMPRAVAEISRYWKVIEGSLRALLVRQSPAQVSHDFQAARLAYQDIEDVFRMV